MQNNIKKDIESKKAIFPPPWPIKGGWKKAASLAFWKRKPRGILGYT
jgi:hypothetical protein